MFSQNNEEGIILNFFKDSIGIFLDFGCNDGKTLSNTHALALKGWGGVCVDPSPIPFAKLCELYIDRDDIECHNVAVSNYNGHTVLFDSGTHLQQNDSGLLSSIKKEETVKWRSTTIFDEINVRVASVDTILELSTYKKYDFISIDCEGNDLVILHQLDLNNLGTKLICIEHNSNAVVKSDIINYCWNNGLRNIILDNAENIIIGK